MTRSEEIFNAFPELHYVEDREIGSERPIKSYILRTNKLSDRNVRDVIDYYPKYGIRYTDDFMHQFADNTKPLIVEIGFGMGESTVEIAKNRPDCNFIGFDVFLNGFCNILSSIAANNLTNLKVCRHDAVEAIAAKFDNSSIDGVHIFFPDPWQKKRHFKRRIFSPPLLDLLSKKLKKGGYIYSVTDWQPYAEYMLEVASGNAGFTNPSGGYCDPVPWRPLTSFESKANEVGRPIYELYLLRS